MCITGIVQFGLAWIIIGWAWSIWWGIRMYTDAQARKAREEERLRFAATQPQQTIEMTNSRVDSTVPVQQSSNEAKGESTVSTELPSYPVYLQPIQPAFLLSTSLKWRTAISNKTRFSKPFFILCL